MLSYELSVNKNPRRTVELVVLSFPAAPALELLVDRDPPP